ncbi:hypothetical protein H4582DRAFT_2129137, partial [Lactarius indigo]
MAYCNDPTCDIPGLAGKIYLRTESSGIGFHVAKQLYACMGGTVYLACWSEVRAHAAMVEVEGEVGIALVVRGPLVLASQLVIKAAADEFAWREERPNALKVNNTGKLYDHYCRESGQAWQTVRAKPPQASSGSDVRLVVASSRVYLYLLPALNFGQLDGLNDHYSTLGSTCFWPEFRIHVYMLGGYGPLYLCLKKRGNEHERGGKLWKDARFGTMPSRPSAPPTFCNVDRICVHVCEASEPRESYIARWTIVQYARRGASAANTRGGGGVCITCGQELIQERPHTRLIKTAALSRKGCERAGSDIKATIAKLLAKIHQLGLSFGRWPVLTLTDLRRSDSQADPEHTAYIMSTTGTRDIRGGVEPVVPGVIDDLIGFS